MVLPWSLVNSDTWSRLTTEYEKINPLAVLPVLTDLVINELTEAGARHYQVAARRLKRMRQLAAGTDQQLEIDRLILELRETPSSTTPPAARIRPHRTPDIRYDQHGNVRSVDVAHRIRRRLSWQDNDTWATRPEATHCNLQNCYIMCLNRCKDH
jgi:hypothetical protein